MKKITLFILISLSVARIANAQCDISPVSAKICRGSSITFSISAPTNSYHAIKWMFGDGDSSMQKTSIINHQYDTFGSFTCIVTLYDITGKVMCGPKFSSVNVFDVPIARFVLLTDDNQHFSQNFFKFADSSVSGNSNAPILARKWYFGDGDSSSITNPTHFYSGCGSYPLTLVVKDSNGCVNMHFKPDCIITNGPKPKFETLNIGCFPPFTIFFKDESKNVTKWQYIKGDGTEVILKSRPCDSVFSIIYKNIGTFYPYLIGYDSAYHIVSENWIKCSATYADPADSNQPHFKVIGYRLYKIAFTGDTLVQSGEVASFIDMCDPPYDTLYWYWGDSCIFEKYGRGNRTHIYNLPDGIDNKKYTIELAASGGCEVHCGDSHKKWQIRVVRSMALYKASQKDELSVFPNPFSSQLNIVLPEISEQQPLLELYDLGGRKNQLDANITGRNILVNRNQILPGMYLLKIITNRVYLGKVIVE